MMAQLAPSPDYRISEPPMTVRRSLRALSFTQPWAWLVLHGKDVENRRWNTRLRGEFLIHAAKGMTRQQYDDALDFAYGEIGNVATERVPGFAEIERGGIVGMATLTDVLAPTFRPTVPWHMQNQYGFRLRHVHALPFLPCKGALSFWGNFEVRDGQAVQL